MANSKGFDFDAIEQSIEESKEQDGTYELEENVPSATDPTDPEEKTSTPMISLDEDQWSNLEYNMNRVKDPWNKQESSIDPSGYDMQLKFDTDNYKYRADLQSGWEQAWRSVWTGVASGALTFAEDVGYLGELFSGQVTIKDQGKDFSRLFDDVYSADTNALSEWARENKEELREKYPIYSKEDGSMDFSDPGFRWSLFRDILDSVVGFGAAGGVTSLGVKSLGKLASRAARGSSTLRSAARTNKVAKFLTNPTKGQTQFATSVGAGALTNYAEGKMIAYDMFEQTMESLKPYMENGELNYQEAATMAGEKANAVQLLNSAIMFTDMYAISKAIKGVGYTRDVIKKPSLWRSAGEIFGRQGVIEAGEEYYQGILTKEAEYASLKEYEDKRQENSPGFELPEIKDTHKGFEKRIGQHMKDPQVLLEAFMGYFGGAGQYGVMKGVNSFSGPNRADHYAEQQKQIAMNKKFLSESLGSINDLDKEISKALSTNNELVAKDLQEMQMYNVIVNSLAKGVIAGGRGDAKGLIDMAQDIISNEETSQEQKDQAQALIDKATEMEGDWLASTAYYNQPAVFMNMSIGRVYDKHLAGLRAQQVELIEKFNERAKNKLKPGQKFMASWNSIKDPKKIDNKEEKKFANDMAKTKEGKQIAKNEESIQHYEKGVEENNKRFDEMTSPSAQKKARAAAKKKADKQREAEKKAQVKQKKDSSKKAKKSLKKDVEKDDDKEKKKSKGKKKKETFYENNSDIAGDLIAVSISNDLPPEELKQYLIDLAQDYEGADEIVEELQPLLDFIGEVDQERLATDPEYRELFNTLATGTQLDSIKSNVATQIQSKGGQISPEDIQAFAAYFADGIRNSPAGAPMDDAMNAAFTKYLNSTFTKVASDISSEQTSKSQLAVLEENTDAISSMIADSVSKGTQLLEILNNIKQTFFEGKDLERDINDLLINNIKAQVRKMKIKGQPTPAFTDTDGIDIEYGLETENEFDEYGLAEPASSIAYQSRAYQASGDFMSLVFAEINDQLNNSTDPKLMSPNYIKEGAKITGIADVQGNPDVYYQVPKDLEDQPEMKGLPKNIKWQRLSKALTALQGSPIAHIAERARQEYISNYPVRLEIKDEQGNIVESYLHAVPWIQPNRVSGKTPQDKMIKAREEKAKLYAFRQELLESDDKTFESEVDFTGKGKLFVNKDGVKRPYSEGIPDISIPLYTVYRGNLVDKKSKSDQTAGIQIANRDKAVIEGRTYALMTMGDGTQMLFPISNQKLSEEMISSIIKAVDIYSKVANGEELDEAEEEVVDHIRENLKHVKVNKKKDAFNIKTTEGIENYIRLFTYTHNLFSETQKSTIDEAESLEEWLDNLEESGVPALRVEPNGIDFGTSNEGKVFKPFDWTDDREGYLSALRDHLGKTYTHVNLEMRGKETNIPLVGNELTLSEEDTYDSFMKKSVLNTSISTPAVTINGKTEFLHTIQRVVGVRLGNQDEQTRTKPEDGSTQQAPDSETKQGKDDYGSLFDENEEDFEESFEEEPAAEDDQAQVFLDMIDDFVIKGLTAKKQSILIDNLAASKARLIIKEGVSMPRMLQELTIEVKDFLPAKFESEVDKIVEMVRQKIVYDFNLDARSQNNQAEDYDMNKEFDKTDESIFEDPKEKMSKIVKMLFYGVVNPDSQSFGNLKEIVDFQQVFHDVMGIGYNARTTDELLAMLTEENVLDSYPYMEEVARRIIAMTPQNKRRLLVQIQKQPVPMKYVYFGANSKGEYSIRIADDNSSDYINYKQQLWKNTLYAGAVAGVNPDTNEIIANPEAAQQLINEFTEWTAAIDDEQEAPNAETVKAWLDNIGIDMHLDALEKMREKGLQVSGRNKVIMWEELFTKPFSGGAFNLIMRDLKEIVKHKNDETPKALDFYKVYKMGRQYRSLALANKPFDTIVSPHTFISGGKRISGFAETTFMSEQVRKLQQGNFERYDGLAFSEGSLWLEMLANDYDMQEAFAMFAVSKDPIRKKGGTHNPLERLDTPTHDELMWSYFQNEGKDEAAFSSMTLSNKKNMWMFNAIAQKFNHDADGNITDDGIEMLYNYIALAEIGRMTAFNNTPGFYNNSAYEAGANIFYFFPSMNNITELKEDDGSIVEGYEVFKEQIKTAIRKDLEGITAETRSRWIESGIISLKDGKEKMELIDKKYKAQLLKRMEDKSDQSLVNAAIADFEINYLLARTNMFQTIYGDIANYYKEGKSIDGTIDATFQNLEKRLAGEVAPGALGESSASDVYNVLVISDAIIRSRSMDYYEILKDEGILSAADIKAYNRIESTDAGEFTTLEEHINVLYKFGKIDENRQEHLLSAGKAKTLTPKEVGYLMKVVKPVQVAVKKEGNVERKIYIKSASYPLIPQMVEGTELDKLMKFMEQNNIQRVAPESAVKLGRPELAQIFDSEGNIIDDIELGESVIPLLRSDFRIQQETPEKDPFVKRFSQASKLAFMNYMHLTNIKVRGMKGTQTAEDLFEEYIKMVSGSANASKTKLLNQISTDGKIDKRKIADILRRSAESLGYSRHEVEAFTTTGDGLEFLAPLWMLSGTKRFEQIVNSMVNRSIINDKMPGYGHKLVSEEGWVGPGESLEGKGIVFTDEWDGHLRSIQEDGKLTTYDIILPWNFQGADMSDFMTSDGKINSKLLDKDLLTMFGIRIPTQSVKSMAAVRVVGFLPKGSDVAIGSRDLVVKTGWDFDYDAFYTYHYNTVINPEGKLVIFDKNTYGRLASDPDRTKVLYKRLKKSLEEYQEAGGTLEETFTEDNLARPITQADLEALKERFDSGDVDIEDESTIRNVIQNMTPDNSELKKIRNQMNEMTMLLEGKAHFQNKMIDIHLGLMQHETVMADQSRALEGDVLEDLAQFVAEKTAAPSKVHISSGSQSSAYTKASGAKDMVSIMARLNVFYAMLQTSGSDMTYFRYRMDENGFPEKVLVNIDFGRKKGNAKVNAVRTYEDNPSNQQRSEILSRMLSAAVDDANEQILRRINLSSTTSPIFKGMFYQGYEDDMIVMMLNQPITYFVTREAQRLVQKGVSPQSALEIAIQNADDIYQTEDEEFKVKTQAKNISITQLKNAIGKDIDKMSRTDLNNQLRILKSMKYFVNQANELSTAEEAANMDSNTSGSLVESIERQRVIEENIEGTRVDNIMDFIGDFSTDKINEDGYSPVATLALPSMESVTDQRLEDMGITRAEYADRQLGFKPLGIAGVVYQTGILTNNELWLSTNQNEKPTYFYRIPEVAQSIRMINDISRNSAKSPAAVARQSEMATRMLITYILTDIAKDGNTAASVRNALSNTKDSVARRLKELKNEDPDNPLLQQIAFNTRKQTFELPFLINTGGDRTLELHMANQLKRLARKEPQLMMDLMKLEMAIGSTTNYFNNIWRMLSPQIMRALGFSSKAYNYDFRKIGDQRVLVNGKLIPAFVEQFFQNNPREAVLAEPGQYYIAEDGVEVKTEEDQTEFIARVISGEDLTIGVNPDNGSFGYKGEDESALPYIRIDGGKQFGSILMKLESHDTEDNNQRIYKPFAVMGGTFRGIVFREFEPGVPATQSQVNPNPLVRPYEAEPKNPVIEREEETPDQFHARVSGIALNGEKEVSALTALTNMLNSSLAGEAYTEAITMMGDAIIKNQSGLMNSVKFSWSRRHPEFKANPEPGEISRNPLGTYKSNANGIGLFSDPIYNLKKQNTNKTTIGTMVHESIHAYTVRIFEAEPSTLSQREASFLEDIKSLLKSAKANLSKEEQAIIEDVRLNGSMTKVPVDQARAYYPFVNEKEFIAGLFTSQEFVNKISGMTYQGKDNPKSLLQRFFEKIVKLLGIQEDSIAYEAVSQLWAFTKTTEGGAADAFFYEGRKLIMSPGENVRDTITRYEKDGFPGPAPGVTQIPALSTFAEEQEINKFVFDADFETVSDELLENVVDAEGVSSQMVATDQVLDTANVFVYFKEGPVDPATLRSREEAGLSIQAGPLNAEGYRMYVSQSLYDINKEVAQSEGQKHTILVLLDTPSKMAAELESKLAALPHIDKSVLVTGEDILHIGEKAIENIQKAVDSVLLSEKNPEGTTVKPINVTSRSEYKDLDNGTERPFSYEGTVYISVEQAMQAIKTESEYNLTSDLSYEDVGDVYDQYQEDLETNQDLKRRIMESTDPAQMKRLGDQVVMDSPGKAAWARHRIQWMDQFVLHSLLQNENHARTLMNTGQAEIIHDAGQLDFWSTEFPKSLMKARGTINQVSRGFENAPSTFPPTVPFDFEESFEPGQEEPAKEYLREGVAKNPVIDKLENELTSVNNSIAILTQRRNSTDKLSSKKNLAKLINNKNLEKKDLERNIREVEDSAASTVVIEQAHIALTKIKDYLSTQDVRSDQDHVEMVRLAEAWSDITRVYENTWESPKREVMKELALVEKEIRNDIEPALDEAALAKVLERVNEELIGDFTEEDITKVDSDESGLTRELLDITMTGMRINMTADKIIDTARRRANEYFRDIRDNITQLDIAKDGQLAALGLDESIFRQKDTKGRITGSLITPYSPEFYAKQEELLQETQVADDGVEKRAAWKSYDKFMSDNVGTIDIEELISVDGIIGDEQAIIDQLAENHGEITAERIVKDQISKLNNYHVDLEMETEELAQLFKEQELADAIELWKMQNSPYYYINSKDKWLSEKSVKKLGLSDEAVEYYSDGNIGLRMKGNQYLIELPILERNGKLTKWANKDFRIILDNRELLEFHAYVREKLEQMRLMSPIGARKRLEKGAIPFFSQQMKQQLMELSSISRKGKEISDSFIRIMRDDMKGHGKDLFDPEQNRIINASYIKTEADQIKEEDKRLTVEFITTNDRVPSNEEQLEIHRAAQEVVASINMPSLKDVVIAHAANASVYHFKHSSEDILLMLENASKGVIDLSRSKANDAPVIAKNAASMLSNQLDTYFMVKNEKGQEFGDKVYTYGEKQLKAEFDKELETINKFISKSKKQIIQIDKDFESKQITGEERDAQQGAVQAALVPASERKEELERSIDNLGGKKTDQGMVESIAHAYHVKTLGWKLSSGIMNLIYGVTSNFVEGGAGVFYNDSQIASAYKLVFRSVLKNVGIHTDTGAKIANLMYKLDVLKEMSSDTEEVREEQSGGFWKRNISNPYEILKSTEYLNQAPIAVAILMNHTVTSKDGETEVNMWEALNTEGGWDENYEEPDQETLDLIKTKIDTAIRMIHGNYDPMRRIKVQRGLVGRLASMFRRWIPNGFAGRFKSEWTNDQIGITFKGRYLSYGSGAALLGGSLFTSLFGAPIGALGFGIGLATGKFSNKKRFIEGKEMGQFKELIFITKQLVKKMMLQGTDFDSKYRTVDAQNLRRNLNEIMVILSMWALKFGFEALKDLLEENKTAAGANRFMANMSNRALKEIAFFVTPKTFMEISQEAIPLLKFLEDMMDLTTAAARTAAGDGTIETGAYAKQNRLWRATKKNFPVLNNFYTLDNMTKTELGGGK